MKLATIVGSVVSTMQHPTLDGRRLLLAQLLDDDRQPVGPEQVVVDLVGAGPGEEVLVLDEGSSARLLLASPAAPVRAVVVGIVDALEVSRSDG